MSRPSLSARDRRAVLVGLLVLAPGLGYVWAVRPYENALASARDELATERGTLSRELGALAAARRNPALQQMTDSALQIEQPRLFAGRDDVIASAELASYLGDVARHSHVWLQDAATRPATSTTPGVRELHVDLRAESDYRGVLLFLDALAHGGKLVRVERMDVSTGFGSGNDQSAETLTITATVTGYAMSTDAPAAPAVAPLADGKAGNRP